MEKFKSIAPKKIFIFRHGETDWNRLHRMQGHTDIPLNDLGRTQAKLLIEPAKKLKIERFFSSDLSRAYETALAPAQELGLAVERDPRLREAHMGEGEGLHIDDLVKKFGNESLARWRSSKIEDLAFGFPGGETGNQVLTRVFGFLTERLSQIDESRIGIVSHGAVLRRMIQSLDPDFPFSQFIPNGVVFTFEFDPKTRLWTFVPQSIVASI